MHISISRIPTVEDHADVIAEAVAHHLCRSGVDVSYHAGVWREGVTVMAIHHRTLPSRHLDGLMRQAVEAAAVQATRHQPLFAA